MVHSHFRAFCFRTIGTWFFLLLSFVQNIDGGYLLEPPQDVGRFLQDFRVKIRKITYTLVAPSLICKSGVQAGSKLHGCVRMMDGQGGSVSKISNMARCLIHYLNMVELIETR